MIKKDTVAEFTEEAGLMCRRRARASAARLFHEPGLFRMISRAASAAGDGTGPTTLLRSCQRLRKESFSTHVLFSFHKQQRQRGKAESKVKGRRFFLLFNIFLSTRGVCMLRRAGVGMAPSAKIPSVQPGPADHTYIASASYCQYNLYMDHL